MYEKLKKNHITLVFSFMLVIGVGAVVISGLKGEELTWHSVAFNVGTELIGAAVVYMLLRAYMLQDWNLSDRIDGLLTTVQNWNISGRLDEIETLLESTVRPEHGLLFRDPQDLPEFSNLLMEAQKIDLCALTLTATLIRQRQSILNRLREGADVRILVMDPALDSAAVRMATVRSGLVEEDAFYQTRLNDTVEELKSLHEKWADSQADSSGSSNVGSLSVRILPFAPSFGVFCFDFDPDVNARGGHVSVSIYSHGEGGNQPLISFGLTSDRDGEWYRYFGCQFEALWKAGKDWTP